MTTWNKLQILCEVNIETYNWTKIQNVFDLNLRMFPSIFYFEGENKNAYQTQSEQEMTFIEERR